MFDNLGPEPERRQCEPLGPGVGMHTLGMYVKIRLYRLPLKKWPFVVLITKKYFLFGRNWYLWSLALNL